MSSPTNAELLAAARTALKRVLTGAWSVTLNGQQFHYSSAAELRALLAEENGTDGRGTWETTFSE